MKYNIEKGYIALITTLVVLAIASLVAISASLLGMSEVNIGLDHNQGTTSYYLAQACAEQALVELKNDISYTGDDQITIGDYQCQIAPILGSGNNYRIIETSSTVGNKIKKIQVKVIIVNPVIIIRSWKQIP